MNRITRKSTEFGFKTLAALVVATNLFSSCVTAHPHLSEADVIAIADRVAIKHGYSLNKFTKRAIYNLRKDNMWAIFYEHKPDSHGRLLQGGFDFTVHVSDDKKETYLIPGR